MSRKNIEDFYYDTAEAMCLLYAMFPLRSILLVEDIRGPIKWDLTGLPDRRSQSCFESLLWLAEEGRRSYRSLEDRNVGIEGAVLTQKGFVLMNSPVTWEGEDPVSRVDALNEARRSLAYANIDTLVRDLLDANCHWTAPLKRDALPKHGTIELGDSDDEI